MLHERRVTLRGLSFRVLEALPETPSGLTVILVHGFADTAATFDLVAPALARAGHHVVAHDQRGFGETDRVPASGYYHFPDYVADLDALVRELAPARLAVVGHSMGGTVTALFAGARPKRLEKIALLEGLGPPHVDAIDAPDRTTAWLDDLKAVAERPREKSFASLEDVVARLERQHLGVDRALLADRARHMAKQLPDGRFALRMDPLHRTTSPSAFSADVFRGFLARIECPALVVSGGPTGYHPPDEAERVAALKKARVVELTDAGHMMHWTAPDALGAALVDFLTS